VRIFTKLKKRGGFSLTELLISVLILALVSAVVATGVPAAVGAFKKVVEKANAQLLLTTATHALRNELDMASDVEVSPDGLTISFISNKNYEREITSGSEGIQVRYTNGGSYANLVSEEAASGLIVQFTGAVYNKDDSTITIKGLNVTNNEGTVLASIGKSEDEEKKKEYTIDVFR